ncbi:hypothetical protein L798_11999 [Zootermopsis nevadensis]|uniref:Uncharacterized protein n=1 Tax=Zootermopsis nevadensis TaxID=136037 RepID=A0A067R4I0_ZOONE|nr:hypothetical protein L798_11999 [Zootermopsis nevadensis]
MKLQLGRFAFFSKMESEKSVILTVVRIPVSYSECLSYDALQSVNVTQLPYHCANTVRLHSPLISPSFLVDQIKIFGKEYKLQSSSMHNAYPSSGYLFFSLLRPHDRFNSLFSSIFFPCASQTNYRMCPTILCQ